jgi:translation initiation factor IF-3
MIRISPVRVIDEDGNQLGVMPTAQALAMAQERGFDLVEVAPNTAPPVTRFLDFGQYKYELAKREKEAKRRSRSVEFKEVRLRPKIGQGDFDTKVHRATEFLGDGDRIKVAVQFRGRELTHPEIGRSLLNRFAEAIKDHGAVDRAPTLEGRSMSMTVTSTHKPKTSEPGKPADGQKAEGPKPEAEAESAGANGAAPAAAPPADAAAPERESQQPAATAAGE